MITIKTPQELAIIKKSGGIIGAILQRLGQEAKPGITTAWLDELAEKLILEAGGIPAFKHYTEGDEPPYPSTICASVNDELVHTPAGPRVLEEGDILSIDIGMRYPATDKGLFTDTAITVPIGKISDEAQKLIDVTKESLNRAIAVVKPGCRLIDIAQAIQPYVEEHGFSVVRQLVGHGVGYEVHEDPRIPNFVDKRFPDVVLKEGMVIAIEPMVNVGKPDIITLDDDWTIATADGSLSAHFEHTIIVTKDGFDIATLAA
jgi:methionyl aminopeptidase